MDKYIEYFTNYVKDNYDIENELIIKKYYHSLRVAWLMNVLAGKLGLSEEDTLLAFKIGLCHDLGRFREVVRSGEFNNKTFDHASYSNKILYNDEFIKYMDIDDHLLFRKAIYCHNKKNLMDNLTNREVMFANMLRDMDKIDILTIRLSGNKLKFDDYPTLVVLYNYMNDLTIDLNDIHNSSDSVILYLGFIKDLVFEESFDIVKDNHLLDDFMNIIDISDEKNDLVDNLLMKIKERRGEYVRKKI